MRDSNKLANSAGLSVLLPRTAVSLVLLVLLCACAPAPLVPYTTDTPALIMVPVSQAGVQDDRGRFREIFCAVLDSRGERLPDHRPCDQALTEVGTEPPGSGASADLGVSNSGLLAALVPGVGWDCVAEWLQLAGTADEHLRGLGYGLEMIPVGALSGGATNARIIRDVVMDMPVDTNTGPRIVLIGYSKGAPDILEAVVKYPELLERVAAVVSLGGAIGGSPLAETATQKQLELLQHFPGSRCEVGDRLALESLRPATRRTWLAENPLPKEIPYYSVATFPQPERISTILKSSYKKLSQVDTRNDGQLVFYDQIIPSSTLVAFLNADHWAIAVPIARSRTNVGAWFVNHNDYPREAMLEALMRYLEESLEQR